ncbi:ABC transporter substrate-binding protein [Cohnella sp. 56]|uniref:ABC transporter substrate-binding protein n=1 Tax=Cohnella sp. 56 TaxID=3113722 RepID=UPI0030EAC79E
MRSDKKRKTFAAVTALPVFFALLVGCAGKSDEAGSPSPSASAPASAQTAKTTDQTPKEKVEVSFWALQFEPYMDEWWKKWVAEFNAQSDSTIIKLEIVPNGEPYQQKLKAAQAAGTAPEIVQSSWTDVIGKYATNGLMLPLDDYLSQDAFDNLFPIARQAVTYKGKHYAYPLFVEPAGVFYYRKDKFAEAGLDPEKPPASWDELIEYGKRLTKEGQYGFQMAGPAAEAGIVSWELEYMLGTGAISDDWSTATVNDDKHKQILQFWKRLYDEKIVPKQPLSGWSDLKPLSEGKVAMQLSGSWGLGQLRGAYKDQVDMKNIGVSSMPTPDGATGVTTTSMGGWFLGIDGKAKHPAAAAEFISWLLYDNNEPMLDFFKAAGYCRFPITNKLNDAVKSDPEASADPFFQAIMAKIIPYALPEPSYPFDIRLAMGSAIDRVIIEGMDIDKSLALAEKEINDFIKKNDVQAKRPNA